MHASWLFVIAKFAWLCTAHHILAIFCCWFFLWSINIPSMLQILKNNKTGRLHIHFCTLSPPQLKNLVQKTAQVMILDHPSENLPKYLLSCNVTVAKWIVSCSQHIVLVIWIEFPPKLYQVTLLLARKEKLPKCQEIPIISAGGKKQFCLLPLGGCKLDLQQWIT